MAEEVLAVFPCIVRKQTGSVYITTDRLIFHAVGSAAEDAQVILLTSISGFIMNKPRPELPQQDQKGLIKIQFRPPGSPESMDRVIEFTGDERFKNVLQCDELLRHHAGDKAEERRVKAKKEAERITAARVEFLNRNPDIRIMHDYLVSEEGGGLSPEEFWEQYRDQLILHDQDVASSESTVPVPLRRPDLLSTDLAANVLIGNNERKNEVNLSPERVAEIFEQFPKAKALFDQLVPASISEKNFWKRFFQSQYFNLSQGKTGTGSDTVFDTLREANNCQLGLRPGELLVDFEVDLTSDGLIREDHVFCALEGTAPEETGGHVTLIKRFNDYSTKSMKTDERRGQGDLGEAMRLRREIAESKSHTYSMREDLSHEDAPTISKADIEKLRKVRTRVDVVLSDRDQDMTFKEIQPGLDGVAKATVEMTTELVSPAELLGGAELGRKISKLSKLPEATEIDEYLDRIIELSKFYFSSKLGDTEKHRKLVGKLNSLTLEMNNSLLPKLKHPSEWMGTLSMINNLVRNVEVVNANLARNS